MVGVDKSKRPGQQSGKLALQQRIAADRLKWQLIELRWQLKQMTEDEFQCFIHCGGVPPRLLQ